MIIKDNRHERSHFNHHGLVNGVTSQEKGPLFTNYFGDHIIIFGITWVLGSLETSDDSYLQLHEKPNYPVATKARIALGLRSGQVKEMYQAIDRQIHQIKENDI